VNSLENSFNLRFVSAIIATRYVQRWANRNLPFRLHRYLTSDSLCLGTKAFGGVGCVGANDD